MIPLIPNNYLIDNHQLLTEYEIVQDQNNQIINQEQNFKTDENLLFIDKLDKKQFQELFPQNNQNYNLKQQNPLSRLVGQDITNNINNQNDQIQSQIFKKNQQINFLDNLSNRSQYYNNEQINNDFLYKLKIQNNQCEQVFDCMESQRYQLVLQTSQININKISNLKQISNRIAHAPDYTQQILSHLQQTEKLLNPNGLNFQIVQQDINEKMREILIDWLIDVHMKFKLKEDTLFIAINIIDRYLEIKPVSRLKLQLLGITSLFIACKYEEVYTVPKIKDLVYVCDQAYLREEILEMESLILVTLDFNLLCIPSIQFLEYYGRIANLQEKNFNLLNYKSVRYLPSMIASATIYLVLKIRKNQDQWPQDQMIKTTGYNESQIRGCAKELCFLLQSSDKKQTFKCLKRKFSQQKFNEVSKIRIEKKNQQQNIQ